jgi:hypothetical protein
LNDLTGSDHQPQFVQQRARPRFIQEGTQHRRSDRARFNITIHHHVIRLERGVI